MNEQEWLKDCESICFECGTDKDLKITSEGVALCPNCLEKEQRFSKSCFDCQQEISQETLNKYPDTELCGECIDE